MVAAFAVHIILIACLFYGDLLISRALYCTALGLLLLSWTYVWLFAGIYLAGKAENRRLNKQRDVPWIRRVNAVQLVFSFLLLILFATQVHHALRTLNTPLLRTPLPVVAQQNEIIQSSDQVDGAAPPPNDRLPDAPSTSDFMGDNQTPLGVDLNNNQEPAGIEGTPQLGEGNQPAEDEEIEKEENAAEWPPMEKNDAVKTVLSLPIATPNPKLRGNQEKTEEEEDEPQVSNEDDTPLEVDFDAERKQDKKLASPSLLFPQTNADVVSEANFEQADQERLEQEAAIEALDAYAAEAAQAEIKQAGLGRSIQPDVRTIRYRKLLGVHRFKIILMTLTIIIELLTTILSQFLYKNAAEVEPRSYGCRCSTSCPFCAATSGGCGGDPANQSPKQITITVDSPRGRNGAPVIDIKASKGMKVPRVEVEVETRNGVQSVKAGLTPRSRKQERIDVTENSESDESDNDTPGNDKCLPIRNVYKKEVDRAKKKNDRKKHQNKESPTTNDEATKQETCKTKANANGQEKKSLLQSLIVKDGLFTLPSRSKPDNEAGRALSHDALPIAPSPIEAERAPSEPRSPPSVPRLRLPSLKPNLFPKVCPENDSNSDEVDQPALERQNANSQEDFAKLGFGAVDHHDVPVGEPVNGVDSQKECCKKLAAGGAGCDRKGCVNKGQDCNRLSSSSSNGEYQALGASLTSNDIVRHESNGELCASLEFTAPTFGVKTQTCVIPKTQD